MVKSKLEQAGYMAVGSSPNELQTLLKSEIEKWSAVIKTVGTRSIKGANRSAGDEAMTGKNRIMICGPKDDGTYLVIKTAAGRCWRSQCREAKRRCSNISRRECHMGSSRRM